MKKIISLITIIFRFYSNFSQLVAPTQATSTSKTISLGDESCPCLTADELSPVDTTNQSLPDQLVNINISTYGVGCLPHDKNVNTQCLPENDCHNIVPQPIHCDLSWCEKSWCYVSPSNCNLYNEPSTLSYSLDTSRFYSYATCGDMDRYVGAERVSQLQGRMLQAGYLKNSGGWKGSYNSKGYDHFARDGWTGALVEIFDQVARGGHFTINRTSPKESLLEKSKEFYGDSTFDYCLYATSLGYLDFCVGYFTITNERATTGSFYTMSSDPVYLYVFDSDTEDDWNTFVKNILKVFAPFDSSSWYMIFLVMLPIISFALVFHESQILPGHDEASKYLRMLKMIGFSIYEVFYGFLAQSYHREVSTVGGRLTVMGLAFFILVLVATYTANLAAIFTGDMRKMKVESIDDAIRAGYTFCGTRQIVYSITDIYEIEDNFVPDPEDGEPGFNCPSCDVRNRVFDSMKEGKIDSSLHCQAAIATTEDIEVLWADRRHCNKTSVGQPIMYVDKGIPMSYAVTQEMIAILQYAKNRGLIRKINHIYQPESICPQIEESDVDISLTMHELSGIWFFTSLFIMASFIFPFLSRFASRSRNNHCKESCLSLKFQHNSNSAENNKS